MTGIPNITKKIIFTLVLVIVFTSVFSQDKVNTIKLSALLEKYKTENKPDSVIDNLYNKLFSEYLENAPEKSIETAKSCVNYFKSKDNIELTAKWYDNIGNIYLNKGIYTLSLEAYLKSLNLKTKLKKNTAWNHVNIGNIYFAQEVNLIKAKKEYQKALSEFKKNSSKNKTNSLQGKAVVYNNFSLIFIRVERFDSALFYGKKALKIRFDLKLENEIIHSHLVIGNIFLKTQQYDSAIHYFSNGIENAIKTQECNFTNSLLTKRALSYSYNNQHNKALDDLENAENICQNKSKVNLEEIFDSYSIVYENYGDNKKALEYAYKTLKYCDTLMLFKEKLLLYERITRLYVQENNIDSAFKFQSIFIALSKELKGKELEKILSDYEIEQNEKESNILMEDIKVLKDENNIRLLFLIISVILIAISIFFGIVIFKSRKDTNKANDDLFHSLNIISTEKEKVDVINQQLMEKNIEAKLQKEIIESYLEELKMQKEKIEDVHKDITDSLEYAKTIQTALLPGNKLLLRMFRDYLVYFRPKEVVSGDFYYASKIYNYNVFAVGDCTGHGVPGAFLSILAISHLNEILRRRETTTTAGVLTLLRERIKGVFKFFGSENSNGLDIALCAINQDKNVLQYAGAFNPLYIIRDNELIEFKATRNPIGFYHNEINFTNHEIPIFENDIFYIFTDGFLDQMGGKFNKKYSKSRFKNLLLSICDLPLIEQKEIIKNTFLEWKDDEEQIDDVTVFAVKWKPHSL